MNGTPSRGIGWIGGQLTALLGQRVDPVTGFAQGARLAEFVRVDANDQLVRHDGHTLDPDLIFDVRLFGPHAELHAWHPQDGSGWRWSRLDDTYAAARGWTRPCPAGRRLLRGRVARTDGEWSVLDDGQSRPLWMPIEAARGERVGIGAVEYMCIDNPWADPPLGGPAPEHGNAGVVAERLTTLEVVP